MDAGFTYSGHNNQMIFDKPPLLGSMTDEVKVNRKSSGVTVEGKWANIRQLVRQFEAQGWRQAEDYPDVTEYNGERLTVVELVQ